MTRPLAPAPLRAGVREGSSGFGKNQNFWSFFLDHSSTRFTTAAYAIRRVSVAEVASRSVGSKHVAKVKAESGNSPDGYFQDDP